jgi:hypothetical protein
MIRALSGVRSDAYGCMVLLAVLLGLLRRDAALDALARMGICNPERLLPAVHGVYVTPSPLLRTDQWGRGSTFVDQWGRTGQ